MMRWKLLTLAAMLTTITALAIVVRVQYVHITRLKQTNQSMVAERDAARAQFTRYEQAIALFNQISEQASQYATSIKGQSDEKKIVYRTIIKRDPAGRKCVPDGVASRLLDYTNSLRASAMHTATGKSDPGSVSAITTACRLTYAQTVYWIDPLLTAIDQANSQLAGIREIEGSRNHSHGATL